MPELENTGRVLALIQRSPQLRARTAEEMIRVERALVTALVGKRPTRAELTRAHLFAGAGIGVLLASFAAWVEGGMRAPFSEVVTEAEAALRGGLARLARTSR